MGRGARNRRIWAIALALEPTNPGPLARRLRRSIARGVPQMVKIKRRRSEIPRVFR